jgi:hypothetical protein
VSLFHPSWHLPTWAAVAIVTAAYVVRSGMRGWDFRPDLPLDAILVAILAGLFVLRWYLKRQGWDRRDDEPAPEDTPDDRDADAAV